MIHELTPRRLLLGTAIALLGLAGCGSDTGISPTGSPAPTGPRAAFIAAADRECTATHHALDRRPQPKAFAEIVPYLDTTIQAETELEQKLRALTPPKDDAIAVATFLDDFHGLLARTGAVRQLAATGNVAATDRALSDLNVAVDVVGAKARRFGFTSCGSTATPGAATS